MEDPSQLVGREQEENGGDGRSGPPQGRVHHHHLWGVRHEHHHAVAPSNAKLDQSGADAAAPLDQITGSKPGALEQQGLVVSVALEGLLGQHREVVDPRPGHSHRPAG